MILRARHAFTVASLAARRFAAIPFAAIPFAATPLTASLVAASVVAASGTAAAASTGCVARSGPHAPAVVELYTSEGCSSCPPADRWLSKLDNAPDVVTLAFHVDYWDSLGWKDRYAQAAFSQRQVASQHTTGARFAYTPQVVVDGRDTPDWPALGPAALAARHDAPAPVALELAARDGALDLTVTPAVGMAKAQGYVAVVDDGLMSRVAAGENRGATLHDDATVRELLPWSAAGTQTVHFAVTAAPEPGAARRYVAVATTADGGRPVQAVALACPR